MKDYHQILGVSPGATQEEIRRAYRRMALKYHPDRNPGDPTSEERFKEISEAYGVLIDPAKRRQYEASRGYGGRQRTQQQGFRYTQEEIFEDLFRNPHASGIFADLLREFERAGVRFDQTFFDQIFFGGRGVLFGGIFVWGPRGARKTRIFTGRSLGRARVPEDRAGSGAGLLERLGRKIGNALLGAQRRSLPQGRASGSSNSSDLHYQMTIDQEEARAGARVQIAIDRGRGKEKLSVRIPPGTIHGTRLRLRGKGLSRGRRTGDLYLTIHLAPGR